jgi:hypothetical protein
VNRDTNPYTHHFSKVPLSLSLSLSLSTTRRPSSFIVLSKFDNVNVNQNHSKGEKVYSKQIAKKLIF